ncbi:UNVERIFIED_CONTAM: hypothetical protein FKN15_031313 [Acipenser sinensis]
MDVATLTALLQALEQRRETEERQREERFTALIERVGLGNARQAPAVPVMVPPKARAQKMIPGAVGSRPFSCHEPGHIARMCPSAMECNVATCYLASETGKERGNGREGPCIIDVVVGNAPRWVKAGRYDGTSPWEAYQAKFKMAALNNAWSPTEKADQLAAALDGKALQVLLDLGPDELDSYDVIATALDRRFGRVEPAVGLRQHLATRIRGPREKLGVLAADVLYLALRGYPDYPPATQGDLAMEAFVRGLTPNALCQQVRLDTPTSLELALAHAERVEAVLEEGGQLDLRTGTLHLQGGPALALAYPEGRAFPSGQLGRDQDPFAHQGQTAKRGELMSQPYPLLHHHGPCHSTLGRGTSALSRTPPRKRVLTPSPTPAPRGNAAFRRAQRRRGLPRHGRRTRPNSRWLRSTMPGVRQRKLTS